IWTGPYSSDGLFLKTGSTKGLTAEMYGRSPYILPGHCRYRSGPHLAHLTRIRMAPSLPFVRAIRPVAFQSGRASNHLGCHQDSRLMGSRLFSLDQVRLISNLVG